MEVTLHTPIEFTIVKRITSYRYYIRNMILNQEVTIAIDLFNNKSEIVHQIVKILYGDEYNNWGADDSYIISIVQAEVAKLHNLDILEE